MYTPSYSCPNGRSAVLLASRFVVMTLLLATTAMARAEAPKVGDTAPAFEMNAMDGSKVKLATLLKKGPVVLVILRGFPGYQCPICNVQVKELMDKSDRFNAAKSQVVLVYPGPAEGLKAHADEFVKDKTVPKSFRFVLDPDYAFLKSYDLRWEAANETSYPSTFVIDRKGKIVFAKISHSHGGRARSEEVLKALGK